MEREANRYDHEAKSTYGRVVADKTGTMQSLEVKDSRDEKTTKTTKTNRKAKANDSDASFDKVTWSTIGMIQRV